MNRHGGGPPRDFKFSAFISHLLPENNKNQVTTTTNPKGRTLSRLVLIGRNWGEFKCCRHNGGHSLGNGKVGRPINCFSLRLPGSLPTIFFKVERENRHRARGDPKVQNPNAVTPVLGVYIGRPLCTHAALRLRAKIFPGRNCIRNWVLEKFFTQEFDQNSPLLKKFTLGIGGKIFLLQLWLKLFEHENR